MRAPNVVLITIDCLRCDHLGCYGYPRNTSPRIDSLASKGALFLEAISNGGQTAAAFPSILASLTPPLGSNEGKILMQQGTTLAELLKEAGYRTVAFHSNPMLSRFYGYEKGFDVFADSLSTFTPIGARVWLRTRPGLRGRALAKLGKILSPVLYRIARRPIVTAKEIADKAIPELMASSERIFLWLHYMDAHGPYMPPSRYANEFCSQHISQHRMSALNNKRDRKRKQLSPPEVETLINLYDACIRHVDDTVGLVLDNLGSDLVNTVVIVTADHGETFGEHGLFGHGFLYDELIRVPLIIVGPGIKAGTVVSEPVELMDLAPTVADFAGIESSPRFHGKSLLPVIGGKTRAATGTISTVIGKLGHRLIAYRTPEWKYIRAESWDEANTVLSEEVYDLRKDPQERCNLHGSEDEEAGAFELEAVDKILELKRLKSEEKTAYEKKRAAARMRELKKSGKV